MALRNEKNGLRLVNGKITIMCQQYYIFSNWIMLVFFLVLIFQTTHGLTDSSSRNKIRHSKNNSLNQLVRASHTHKPSSKDDRSFNEIELHSATSFTDGRCLINASTPEEPKYFYYHDTELPIGILVSDRLTHKLASNVLKVFVEEILGYVNVTLVNMEDPSQGFDPDTQFSYISSCTDPK